MVAKYTGRIPSPGFRQAVIANRSEVSLRARSGVMQMSKVNEESIQKLDVIKHLILLLIYPHYSSLSAPYRRQRHRGIKIGGAFGFS